MGPLHLLVLAVAYEVLVTSARVWASTSGPLLKTVLLAVHLAVFTLAIVHRQHPLYKLVCLLSLVLPAMWAVIWVGHWARMWLRLRGLDDPAYFWSRCAAEFYHCLFVLLSLLVWASHLQGMLGPTSRQVGVFCIYLALAVAGSVVLWMCTKMVFGLVWQALHHRYAQVPLWWLLRHENSPAALRQLAALTATTYLAAFLCSVVGVLLSCATGVLHLDLAQPVTQHLLPATQRRHLAVLLTFVCWLVLYIAWSTNALPRAPAAVLLAAGVVAAVILLVLDFRCGQHG